MANFNFNKVILGGRLTKDPAESSTQQGITVAQCDIAVNRKGKDSGTDFIRVKAFDKVADFLLDYFLKGDSVCITGRINTGSYEKDGAKVYYTEVIAESVDFVDSKSESSDEVVDVIEQAPAKTPAKVENTRRTRR